MKNKILDKLSNAVNSSYEKEILELENLDLKEISYQTLTEEEIKELSKKILSLPLEYKNILFSRYSFKLTPKETESSYDIINSKGKLLYIKRLLSRSFNLDGKWISEQSLEKATNLALEEYVKEPVEESIEKPKYSRNFKRILKEIDINIESQWKKMAKRVAMIFIVIGISFTIFLGTNVQAREKFFDWIVEKYEQYSIFTPEIINEDYIDKVDMDELKINYVPDGFELIKIQKGRVSMIYEYSNVDGDFFYLSINEIMSVAESHSKDTENAEMERIFIKDSEAFYWEHDIKYLLWQQNGVECFISGNIEKNELIKIAENISK